LQVLIIDEISMIAGEFFDGIMDKAHEIRSTSMQAQFQVIATGVSLFLLCKLEG
jgi:hypothetical protein